MFQSGLTELAGKFSVIECRIVDSCMNNGYCRRSTNQTANILDWHAPGLGSG